MTPAAAAAPSKSVSLTASGNALPDAAAGVFASIMKAAESTSTKGEDAIAEGRGRDDANRARARRRGEQGPDGPDAALSLPVHAPAPIELTSGREVADGQASGDAVSGNAGAEDVALRRSAENTATALLGKSTAARADDATPPASPVAAAPVQAPATLAAALQQQVVGTAEPATPDAVVQSGEDGPTLEMPAALAPAAGAKAGGADASSGDAAGDGQSDGKGRSAAGANPEPANSEAGKSEADKPVAGAPAPKSERADADAASNRAADPQPQSDRVSAPAQGQAAVQPAAGASTTGIQLSSSAAVAAQVATAIASHAGQRRTRFEVRLDPGELGRVDVRLDIGHDGRIATRLIVDKAETLDLLRNDARELARMLEQAGFQLGQGGLAFQMRDGRRDDWRDSPQDVTAGGGDASAETDEAAPAAAVYGRARAAAGGVDRTV